jgi:hypothetical protein
MKKPSYLSLGLTVITPSIVEGNKFDLSISNYIGSTTTFGPNTLFTTSSFSIFKIEQVE